jgi:hypothetical protein
VYRHFRPYSRLVAGIFACGNRTHGACLIVASGRPTWFADLGATLVVVLNRYICSGSPASMYFRLSQSNCWFAVNA